MSRRALARLAAALPGLLGTACDDRDAFHAPQPTLARMRQQRRSSPYAPSSFFADGRAMREPPPDTVPQERSDPQNPALASGRDGEHYLARVPLHVSRELVQRGRRQFELICATCHGVRGDGVSVVAEKMQLRRPPSLHEFRVRTMPAGQIFAEISRGYGLMPSYAGMLSVSDRWAIVAYLPALELSQSVRADSLPGALQRELAERAAEPEP